MKSNKINLIVGLCFTLFCTLAFNGHGQKEKSKKSVDIVISTSAECSQCKKRLEEKLNYTKGVRFAELDVPSRRLTVRYSPLKISDEQIRSIISNIGYDADNVLADPKAQQSLPKCCQPGGMNSHGH